MYRKRHCRFQINCQSCKMHAQGELTHMSELLIEKYLKDYRNGLKMKLRILWMMGEKNNQWWGWSLYMEISGLFSDYLSLMLGNPGIKLNNLKTSLRFPCLSLNPIIDSINPWLEQKYSWPLHSPVHQTSQGPSVYQKQIYCNIHKQHGNRVIKHS